MDLPFNRVNYDEQDKFKDRVKLITKEKDLKGQDIKNILIGKLSKTKLKYIEERSYDTMHPLDLAVGDEDNLDLATFEIKGDTDSFKLLNRQIRNYLYVADEFYLVLHKKKAPEYLPDEVGIIRVFENGEVYIEQDSTLTNFLYVSTDSEWDGLFAVNNLGLAADKTKDMLNLMNGIRKNILFNRFFAIHDYGMTHSYKKFYPFDEAQKELIAGFDLTYQIKSINRDIKNVEKRIALVRMAVKVTQLKLN